MQYLIEINDTPNQEFSVNINETDMLIHIREADGLILFSLTINGETLCPDTICCSNQGILPFPYMVSEAGCNFYFLTEDENYPDYKEFGKTCFLYAITEDEING